MLPAKQTNEFFFLLMTAPRQPPVSGSTRAGLVFPVGRVRRLLKKKYPGPVTQTAAVYMAGVLEYMTREVVDVSGEAAYGENRKCITARSIYLGLQNDNELTRLQKSLGAIIPGSGVVPQTIGPKRTQKRSPGATGTTTIVPATTEPVAVVAATEPAID